MICLIRTSCDLFNHYHKYYFLNQKQSIILYNNNFKMSKRYFFEKNCMSNNQRQESSFQITQAFSLMQKGLPASYDYSDFIYVLDKQENIEKLEMLKLKGFLQGINQIIVPYKGTENLESQGSKVQQLVIVSFDTQLWNKISTNTTQIYKPAWRDTERNQIINPNLSSLKKQFYKFDIKILFQIKKNNRGSNPLTSNIQNLLKDFDLSFYKIQAESRSFCEAQNAIIAGRFDDDIQKPKDPYTFFLHCLVGYQDSKHLGGSYLLAQKCNLNWNSIHSSSQSLPEMIGRNQILQGSTIFSQQHCPRSHIRISRVKDSNGNPATLHRQSKTFTTSSFDPLKEKKKNDNNNPEEGIFFIAYHKNPFILEKMLLNQLGNDQNISFNDSLLNIFKVDSGNILYTPNIEQLTGHRLQCFDTKTNIPTQLGLSSLSSYHQINWLSKYKKSQDVQKRYQQTGNIYYSYSRAGYMFKMSNGIQNFDDLNPPSSRILRLISKVFFLWQDTWYYNRKQRQIEHLSYFLREKPEVISQIEQNVNEIGFTFSKYKKISGEWDYQSIPNIIRNGLAIHFLLGHVLSTHQYGCRGPIDGSSNGCFGANTFHLEPQDILVGGEANLTFGQGKYLIEYLTEKQIELNWKNGVNLSAHSGIGHVVPYVEQIMKEGLGKLIQKFKHEVQINSIKQAQGKVELFVSTVFALLGMQQYFINYANYAEKLRKTLAPTQLASIKSLQKIQTTMRHLSSSAPRDLHEGAQLVLSIFICLHITGQPVSIGRLDYVLRNFAKEITDQRSLQNLEEQDIIDAFWIKVGEKANFNKGFFEDHQKWGNLAMGGNSNPFPQRASFNQWGHQLTVGGSNEDDSPFYNSITIYCIRAARRIPVNAPCLGLRLHTKTPKCVIQQASKAILAGGAHPILLNDQKIVEGLRQSGNYIIPKELWDSAELVVDGKIINVPYNYWKTTIDQKHVRDFTSDGCHEFLIAGRSWFWLGGGCTLQGLQYILNNGKSLLESGSRYINGMRKIYRERSLDTYTTFQEFLEEYYKTFKDLMSKSFYWQLQGYSQQTTICPATLLNAFTATMIERGRDFYDNGVQYKLFCPQYTGIANFVNSLWNIKRLVFQLNVTSLEEVREVLLVNWGDQLVQPFVSSNIPSLARQRLKKRCDMLREIVWGQAKFGIDRQVTDFGLKITRKLSEITRDIFQNPSKSMLLLFKQLTHRHGSVQAPFGFQYLPGGSTFQHYEDIGSWFGASFDGRKKGQTLAQDYSPQNLLVDKQFGDSKFKFEPIFTKDIIENYSYKCEDERNPQLFSGAVLDLNIDESYDLDVLIQDITSLAQGKGTNLTTVTCCNRQLMEQASNNAQRDLLRFRMGGWTEFAVAMFPQLLEQQVRRVREIHPKSNVRPTKQ